MVVDYKDIYKQKKHLDKETCDNIIKDLSKDKKMAKMFAGMSTDYKESELDKGWDDVLQDKHEQILNASVTRKPTFIIEKEERERRRLLGLYINELPIPIRDEVLIELKENETRINGAVISSTIDNDKGIVYRTANNDVGFEINDKVLYNNKKEITRFRCNEKTYVLISAKEVLGIYG